MNVIVLGAGLMGKEAVRDLIEQQNVSSVTLADVNEEKAKDVQRSLASEKVKVKRVNATHDEELRDAIQGHDVAINALFYTFNEKVAKAAIETGVHAVDLGGHIGHMTDRVLALHEQAKRASVTIIPDLGVAPGMINILTGYGASQLDRVHTIKLYVGGIPLRPEPPLEYNHVFSLEGLLDHYTDPSFIIRDGQKRQVPSLSEVETIYFDRFGPLEAFHTSGGTSTLPQSYPHVKCLEYKTIRYPGHAEKFRLLVDLQLTRRDYEVEVDGKTVCPRDVLLKVLTPLLDLKEKEDVVLLRVIVAGEKDGKERTYEYEMVTHKDRQRHVTAMARSTAYTVSVVAQMIGDGTIQKRGAYPPEQIVPGDRYIEEMIRRGVVIHATVR